MNKLTIFTFILGLFLCFTSISCDSLRTASFDQYSYQKAIEIKVESGNLMDEATTSYSGHLEAVKSLLNEVEKIKEYEKYKPDNDITFQMWKILSDKEKNLLAGFFRRWKAKGQLSKVFIGEAKPQVVEALNLIIQYEGHKEKETKKKLMGLIDHY